MQEFKIEKDFISDGYRCVIVGLIMGHRCGYIGVPKEHPLYGKHYDDIEIDIHGGWTYSENTDEGYPIESDLWWIGFDCAHAGDGKDFDLIRSFGINEYTRRILALEAKFPTKGTGRPTEYVQKELVLAAHQLKEIYK